jgi:hypothetical protein
MKKYKLEVYGWEMEVIAHSLNGTMVSQIKKLVGDDEISNHHMGIDDILIQNDRDHYDADLFRMSKPFWYSDNTYFRLFDDSGELLSEFLLKDITPHYEVDEDCEPRTIDCYPNEIKIDSHYPNGGEYASNILLIVEENKGGLFTFEIESEDIPTVKDFSVISGDIETPDPYYEFCDKFYFRGNELEIFDYLDNNGKASTYYLFEEEK